MAKRPTMPNAENCSLAELTIALNATPKKESSHRLTAIKALMLGISHGQVAALYNITRRTLFNWITRFNEKGIDGLIEKPRSGRPRKISQEQSAHYRELVEHPERAEQRHWTAKKFHGYLRDHLQHEVGYRTVVRWLHEQDFKLKVPQPWPDRQDEAERHAFLERLRAYLNDPEIDIWYLDEMGIEGDPRPRRRWAQKGEKTRVPYRGRHLRVNVTGLIAPRSGQFYALEFSHSDTVIFQTFLDHANRDVNFERPRNLLICDNAAWHKSQSIDWGNFKPIYLPAYSPDLNPIERLWLLIKAEWFSDFIAKNMDQLLDRCDQALVWAINRKKGNQKTCSIKKEL